MSKMVLPCANFFPSNLYQDNYRVFQTTYDIRKRSFQERRCENGRKDGSVMGNGIFRHMRGFLILGRLLGILPVSGVFSSSHTALSFRFFSVAAIINMAVTVIIGFSTVISIMDFMQQSKSNALEIAKSIQGSAFRVWILYCYVYFLLRAKSFVEIFKTWEKCSLTYLIKDKTLKRDIIIVCGLIFTSALVENVALHLEYFPQLDYLNGKRHLVFRDNANVTPTIEVYYERSHPEWKRYLGYHPLLAALAFVTHKFVVFSWNYVDATMVILARALYFRFRALCEVAKEKLEVPKELGPGRTYLEDRSCWTNIVKDHDTLCSLLEKFEKFLSPLIFGSYVGNIYYICMQLIEGLSPNEVRGSLLRSIFAPVSFFTIMLRMYLITNAAARINTFAHEIGNTLKKCPIELYDAEVARVDRHVTSGPDIGLTGLGCFTVTKPFLLSIINVIFTIEIVLLQGITTATPGSCS